MTSYRATRHRLRTLARRILPAIVSLTLFSVTAQADPVPNPLVTGPIAATAIPGDPSHNYPFFATNHPLSTAGYIEEEFFIQGTANRYTTPALTTATVIDGGHPYMTRMVVRRPVDPKQFNGTVLVEWYNVTNGFDAENLWFFDWEHILGNGYVWVGVSAQNVGVAALKVFSPTRYAGFDVTAGGSITGDALSYDIFSQAGQAIRHPAGVDPLGGLKPKVVIGIGESQSASRLSTYVNSIEPLAHAFDGYLLLSSLGNKIRTDLTAPVWKISTEYDVQQSEALARQPDTSKFRHWEVAGSSHVDQHLRDSREPLELRDRGTSSEAALAPTCGIPTIGTRVATKDVIGQAFEELVPWITSGKQPPSAPEMQTTSLGPPTVLARNSLGLALGGIQLSQVAVPTALNVGTNSGPPGSACVRWGYYVPFSVSQLDSLYRNHDDYVRQVAKVAHENVRQGHIGVLDARHTVFEAINSAVGGRDRDGDYDRYLVEFAP
ncbi:MAG TPA: alpha/beta hydrolase domain-containing protein [Stellaceae bacterium]